MSTYAIARLPLLSPDGDLIAADPRGWHVEPALRYGVLRLRNGSLRHTIDLRTALAAEVSEETKINDIRKTLGRMALTGLGSSLFWEGRRGGIGAGLLDLSARGVEKKGVYGGSLVFRDTSVVNFVLFEQEFEHLARLVPEAAFEEEALDEARELLDLLERMRADGRRALEEFAGELIALDAHLDDLLRRAEAGASFAERDKARTEAAQAQGRLSDMRHFFRALLVENGVHYRDFAAAAQLSDHEGRLLAIAGPSVEAEAPLPVAQIAQARSRSELSSGLGGAKEVFRNVVRVVFVLIVLLMIVAALTGKR